MNKKLFASAIFAAGAFVSTSALAALGFETSVGNTTDGYLQDGNAKVAAGGSSVRANDILINIGADTDMPAKSEIVIRLPKGLNFDGVPGFKVTQGTPGVGLTLVDGSEFGDPTLDDPGVTWADANGDGGYDRAVVAVGAAGKAGDSLTISVNLTADSTATAGVKKISVVINSGLAVPQNIVEVVSGFTEPVFSASGTQLSTVSQSTRTVKVTTATFTVTLPKGTAKGKGVTMTPQDKLVFSSNGSTITYVITSPVKLPVFTVASSTGTFAAGIGTKSLTFTVSNTTTVDTQVTFTVNEVETATGIVVGTRGLTISGAVDGTAALIDVKKSGSSAALTTVKAPATNKVAEIVAGSSADQDLPTIDITENFVGDAIKAGSTGTITLTPGAGLNFGATSSITVVGTNWYLVAPSATLSAKGVLTLTLKNSNTVTAKKVTIKGLKATAAKTATGDLSVTVGSPSKPDKSTAPNDTLVVAKPVALGTVTVAGPTTLKNTAPGGVSQTATITLKEGTYGALNTANASQTQNAFFRLTPSANTNISAIATSFKDYDAGTTPTISACVKETNVTTGAWICKVDAESTKVTPTTSTISLAVDYQVGAKVASGSKVTLTIDGNANVSGSVDIANVGIATTATKGAVPNVTPGGTEVVNFATLTIKEKFAGAVTQSKIFRLIAPQGAVFQNAAAIVAQSAGISAATITSTFNPNDTLVMTNATTATIVVTTKGLLSSSAAGFQSFSLVDGDLEGKNKAGITAESVMLAYGGTLEALDAGKNADVNVGYTVQNTVKGGLNTTDYPYTVASSNASVASPTITASVVTVTGKAVGNAIITVTDGLGAAATYTVTVSAGAAEPAAEKAAKASDGSATSASFTGGATSDGGTSFATEFTTSDTVTLVGTVNIDAADQGEAGAIYVALSKKTSSGTENFYMDESGTAQPWDLTVANLGEHIVAESLAASYDVQIHNGTLAAGEYRVALAYSVGGKLIYTAKAMVITVTE